MNHPQKDIKDLYRFLGDNPLSTLAINGVSTVHPHLSTVYTFLGENKKLYFITKNGTDKYTLLNESPHVTLLTHTEQPPISIKVEGSAREIREHDEKDLFTATFDLAMKTLAERNVTQPPLTKLVEAGTLVIFEVTPTTIVYSDYRKNDAIVFQLES